MSAPVVNHPCVKCGQLDDHPMAHFSMSTAVKDQNGQPTGEFVRGTGWTHPDTGVEHYNPSFHHDCIPQYLINGVQDDKVKQHLLKIVDAANRGTRGDKLREFITKSALKPEER